MRHVIDCRCLDCYTAEVDKSWEEFVREVKLSPKAMQALHAIDAGRRDLVTNQMIDRLSSLGFIDFGIKQEGWWLTEAGKEKIR